MKRNFLVKIASWTMAHISWMTMAFSPVALGKEAENISTQSLKETFQELQLNRKMTLQEFWEKTKADYPGYAYYEIEQLVKSNPSALIPQFQIKSVKGSDGVEVPVLTFTENGKSHTIQIYGDVKRYLTFDGVNISAAESTQPEKIFQKLMEHDAKLENQYDSEISKEVATQAKEVKTAIKQGRFSSFTGFPRVTPQMWQAMSAFDRAQYIVLMRSMWQDARRVNFYSEQDRLPSSEKKQPKRKTSSLEQMYKVLIGDDANAANYADVWTPESCARYAETSKQPNLKFCPATASRPFTGCSLTCETGAPQKPPQKPPTTGATPAPDTSTTAPSPIVDGSSGKLECINAGWITQNAGGKCSYGVIKNASTNRYDKEFLKDITNDCKPKEVACNPLTFGYTNEGKTKCFPEGGSRTGAATDNAQKATHFGGPCDVVNPLGTEFALKGLSRENQLVKIEKDQASENYGKTQQYLDSIIKHHGKGSLKALLDSGKWNKEIDDLLVQSQKSFEDEVTRAIGICDKTASDKKQYDRNQQGACDQLHRRWLFTEQFISKYRKNACPAPTQYLFGLDVAANNNAEGKKKNKTHVDALNKNKDSLPCGCLDKATNKMMGFEFGLNPAAPAKCNPVAVVVPDGCPAGSVLSGEMCVCNESKKEFKLADLKDKKVLPDVCGRNECSQVIMDSNGQIAATDIQYDGTMCNCTNGSKLHKDAKGFFTCAEDVVQKCDKYPPLNTSGKLNDQCQCIDKKGKVKGMPKKVKTGFVGFFTSSGKKSDKDANGDRYTCDQGPNWWKIIGIGAGIAVLIALLTKKKKKCPPGATGKYPNCIVTNQCTPPKQLIDNECICNVRCAPNYTMNPITCECTAPTSEGGDGDPTCNPAVNPDCGYGGTGQ